MKKIAIFCGSKKGSRQAYQAATVKTAKALLERRIGMVYGGGHVGLMGIAANVILEGKGEVIGVIPEKLVDFEVAHSGLTHLHIVKGMHPRKALMMELSDGFLALPGGIGTMEELFEVFTWQHIGYHQKPCGLLNVDDYYTPLLRMIDQMVDHGFLKAAQRDRLLVDTDVERLLDSMEQACLQQADPAVTDKHPE